MAKNVVEDVRPPRSIRDIPISTGRNTQKQDIMAPAHGIARHANHAAHASHEGHSARATPAVETDAQTGPLAYQRRDFDSAAEHEHEHNLGRGGHHAENNDDAGHSIFFSRWSKYFIWGVVLACVIALFFISTVFFTSAEVTVTPRTESSPVNASLLATKNSQTGDVEYQLVSVTAAASSTVPAQGEVMVSTKATGQITVYNDYSASPQTLIKNTRFQTATGLIYRINSQITVPGKAGSTPGALTVNVTADQPGSQYDIGASKFTVPGLASDHAKFAAIYAQSKTYMAGGVLGMEKQVTPSDEAAAKNALDAKIGQELSGEVAGLIPSGYVFFPNAATTTFETQANISTSSASASITEQGVLNALVFSRSQLSAALAKQTLNDYDDMPVDISNITTLNLSFAGGPSAWNGTSLTISLTGNANFVWQYSTDAFKQALKGQPSSNIPSILLNFPAITKATVLVRPFWISTLPSNVNRISLTVSASQ